MENNNYYLKPEEILQECLYGVEWIKDVTRRESEEEVLSSDEETDEEEEESFESSNEVKKRDLKTKSEGEIIEISDESQEKVVKVSREVESISLQSEKKTRGLVSISGNNVRNDSKADLKGKVMIKSPPLLPFGWDKMKKEELLEKFIAQNQGKQIPEYLLKNLREADYEVVKNEDKKKLKSKIQKEKENKEVKKEIGNKNNKMDKSEVRFYFT